MGGYPEDWEGKSMDELANEDGTYGKNRSTVEEVELFMYVMRHAMDNVANEMNKQLAKWGVQEHPSFRISDSQKIIPVAGDALNVIPSEEDAKRQCETQHEIGKGTWADILVEELAEALGAAYRNQDPTGFSVAYPEGTPEELNSESQEEATRIARTIVDAGSDDVYYEVLQTAAVAMSWVTAILLGRNRNVATKEYQEYKIKRQVQEEMLAQVRGLLTDGGQIRRGPALESGEGVVEDWSPGGYI